MVMIPPTHILVPTDFGDAARHALKMALGLAAASNAKVTILHTTWLPPSAYAAYAEGVFWPTDEMSKGAAMELEEVRKNAARIYGNVETKMVTGEPWEQILAVAKDIGADLIVMGTHGRRGVARAFIGSVAEKVVRMAGIPVLVARAEEHIAA
jgi:nucleotide-binding universal stress UspA family protein